MIFRILNWFKRKENKKERKRATVRLSHGLCPRLRSQPSQGPNPRPTTTGLSEKRKRKKEKESFAVGTLNLFLKPLSPFHYFLCLWYLCIWNPLFVSNSSFNSFSFFGRQNQTTVFRAEGGGDDETEAD